MKNSAARKMKQVPEGYLIVGIDPHKKKHAVVTITQDSRYATGSSSIITVKGWKE